MLSLLKGIPVKKLPQLGKSNTLWTKRGCIKKQKIIHPLGPLGIIALILRTQAKL